MEQEAGRLCRLRLRRCGARHRTAAAHCNRAADGADPDRCTYSRRRLHGGLEGRKGHRRAFLSASERHRYARPTRLVDQCAEVGARTASGFRRRVGSRRKRPRPRVKERARSIRPVKRIVQSKPAIEGAGVKLRRAFGFGDTGEFDPFLLLDDFRNDRPDDYRAGFPWHPHRGIETITYVLAGSVDHGDSLGNRGTLGAGDVQWMTAGSGILHQEMPQGDAKGRMHGFQLWANLPSSLKMTAPRYQDIKAAEIPEIVDDDGTRIRVVCGDFWGRRGPVEGVAADPRYLDVSVPPGRRKTLPVETGRHAFAYVFEGSGTFSSASQPFGVLTEKTVDGNEALIRERTGDRSLVLFDSGDKITVQAGGEGMRFLLVSGKPIEEPVAWYGPIVMNTQAKFERAFAELKDGTFIKRS